MAEVEISDVLNQLTKWGASNPVRGEEGIIFVQTEGIFELYDYKEREIFPFLLKMRRFIDEMIFTESIPGLYQTKYVDPVIGYTLNPKEINTVEINLTPWNLYVKGVLKGQQDNKSTEGQQCTKRMIQRQWSCEYVPGSADLTTKATNTMNASDQNLRLCSQLQQSYNKVSPNNSISASATWRTSGAWDWLVAVVNILVTGSCNTSGGIDTTASYT